MKGRQKKFLEEIATRLIAVHQHHFEEVIVVVPANRAKLFLKKHLHEQIGQTFWAPQLMVMPEWVEWLGNQKPAGTLELMLHLYQAYANSASVVETFEEFCRWAPAVLNDFNDVDQYLVKPEVIFSNLREVDYVEQWSLGAENLSSTQQRYLSFWEDLGKTYFHMAGQTVTPKSYAALTRLLTEQPEKIVEKLSGKTIWFVGMASFTPAEEELIKHANALATVQVVWDADDYYIGDAMNNAGSFLRHYASKNHLKQNWPQWLTELPKQVVLNETTTATGQVFALTQDLQSLTEEELNDTAIVLADITLTEPLMQALPKLEVPVNMALGLPLRGSIQNKWVATLLHILSKKDGRGIHHQLFTEWLSMGDSFGIDTSYISEVREEIAANNLLYLSEKKWRAVLENNITTKAWYPLLSAQSAGELLLVLAAYLRQSCTNRTDELHTTSVAMLANCCDRLLGLLTSHPFAQKMQALEALWQLVISRELVQWQGEPIRGLQVLSMVETRALDFDHVYLLGANEDSLPGNAQPISYIPWDVRHEYGLPLPDEREAMYAYTFYRLLQRATNIHFYYSAVSSDFRGTEPSRYLQQLEAELPQRNALVQWKKRKHRFADHEKLNTDQRMPNDDFAKSRLDALLASGLSPSAIGKFNQCPLDFYYRYIIGLGEADEVEEQVGAATFGSIVHDVLERFYENYRGTYPTSADYAALTERLDEELKIAFGRKHSAENLDTGYNALAFTVAGEMLRKLITIETLLLEERTAQGIQPELLGVESILEREIDTSSHDWHKPVKLRGKGDRLEHIAGFTHILDYKTGKVKKEDYTVTKSLTDLMHDNKAQKALQLIAYIYMYTANGLEAENIKAAFYSFTNHKAGYTYLNAEGRTNTALLAEFESALMQWVKDLYALEHYEHNEESKYCQYCGGVEK